MSPQTTLDEPQLFLHARTAAELMTPDPISISATATVREAIDLLTIRGFSAAPVIDAAGRPVGGVCGTATEADAVSAVISRVSSRSARPAAPG